MTGQPEPPVDPYAVVDYPAAYPPPYWGYAVDPYRISKPAGTNANAIGALVASVVGLFCCGLPSVAGVILGVIAMRETKRTGQDGYGIALAGTVIGGSVAALWAVFVLMWLLGVIVTLTTPTYS